MPHLTKLNGVRQDDILCRINAHEQGVCALSGSNKGWGNTVAWNPVAECKSEDYTDDISVKIEEFVKEQQQNNRLMIGYMSYEYGCLLHDVTLKGITQTEIPLVCIASFSNWIDFDKNGANVYANDTQFVTYVELMLKRKKRKLSADLYKTGPQTTLGRTSYGKAFKKIKRYIIAGDVYQVNLTHRLEATTDKTGRDIFCTLYPKSRANFQAYIEHANFEIMSFSPERFIRVKNGVIETSPIKGTRPRGATVQEDQALAEDLLHSPKDRAELDMITDLLRNDLGKICLVGSVKVTQKRAITAYPSLWHANSTIKGRLNKNLHPIAALASLMPGGSVTGCPKKRSLEIIDEVEPTPRNIYTGSIFTIKHDGELDSNIAIRTMLKKANKIYLPVGGGIVYDSKEEDEYQESIDKARSFTIKS